MAPTLLLRPDPGREAYNVKFRVRVPARCRPDAIEQARNVALERMIPRLYGQGWEFVGLAAHPPRGPFPVAPVRGVGRRPARQKRVPGRPSSRREAPDDALWRISTLPTFGPQAAHLLTDEVEWEFAATFHRPRIATEIVTEEKVKPTQYPARLMKD